MCSDTQEKSFLYFVGHNSLLKLSMQLGLVTRTCWCLYFCRFFCLLDSFLKGHSNNSLAQIVTQCYYIPDVELWICLCGNSLQFFAKSCFKQRWEKNIWKTELEEENKHKRKCFERQKRRMKTKEKNKKNWKSATAIKCVCFYVAFTFKNVSDLRNKEKILCYISNTIILFGMAE